MTNGRLGQRQNEMNTRKGDKKQKAVYVGTQRPGAVCP